jgi:hypothetical protein
MIADFVGAEIDSTRFGPAYKSKLREIGADESVVRKPNLAIAEQNRVRHNLLAFVRGYPSTMLFQGFPRDVTWVIGEVTMLELGQCIYANHETWRSLSNGTRLVQDGAANIDTVPVIEEFDGPKVSVNDRIRAIARAIEEGAELLPLIALSEGMRPPVLIAEGHSRATAHLLAAKTTGRATVHVQLGISRRMREWAFW